MLESLKVIGNYIYDGDKKYPLYYSNKLGVKDAYKIKAYNVDKSILYPFQYIGACFLLTRKKAILSDDTGIGKTVQALFAADYLLKNNKVSRVIISCPKAITEQWKEEIKKFVNEKAEIVENIELDLKYSIMNYEKIRKANKMIPKDTCLILDEASKLKNFNTKNAQSLYFVNNSDYIFMLTATPIENSPLDLWALFKQLKNNYFKENSEEEFINNYAITEKNTNSKGYNYYTIVGWKDLNKIKRIAYPLILKRTINEVYNQLPEKLVKDVYIELTSVENKVYNRIKNEIINDKGEEYILSLYTLLKRFLDSPDILKSGVLIYDLIEEKNLDIISSKLIKLMEIVDELKENNKIVIFTQYSDMAIKLGNVLETPFLYYGDLSSEVIDKFNNSKKGILVMTDKGAYGLNIQSANVLVNYDLPWNPAILKQRLGRIYRIGQTKKTVIINMQVLGFNKIDNLIRYKLKLKDDISNEVI